MTILAITVPIFMYVAIGYILKEKKIIDADIKNFLSKLVYYFAFPMLTFRSILAFDFSETFRGALVLHNLLITSIIFIATLFLAYLIKNKHKRGAFQMSSFRSNQGYIGLPVVQGFYQDVGMSRAAVVNGFDTPYAIILSVIALEIFKGNKKTDIKREGFIGKSMDFLINLGQKMIAVVTNPFIISSFLGLILSYFNVPVLEVKIIDQFLIIATGMALPLAVISVGCSIEIHKIKKNLGLILKASFIKLIIMPLIAFVIGYYIFKFEGLDLGLCVILTAMPSSISSYVMALEMDTDEELSASIIGFTTLISVVTVSIIQYFLKLYFI